MGIVFRQIVVILLVLAEVQKIEDKVSDCLPIFDLIVAKNVLIDKLQYFGAELVDAVQEIGLLAFTESMGQCGYCVSIGPVTVQYHICQLNTNSLAERFR